MDGKVDEVGVLLDDAEELGVLLDDAGELGALAHADDVPSADEDADLRYVLLDYLFRVHALFHVVPFDDLFLLEVLDE